MERHTVNLIGNMIQWLKRYRLPYELLRDVEGRKIALSTKKAIWWARRSAESGMISFHMHLVKKAIEEKKRLLVYVDEKQQLIYINPYTTKIFFINDRWGAKMANFTVNGLPSIQIDQLASMGSLTYDDSKWDIYEANIYTIQNHSW